MQAQKIIDIATNEDLLIKSEAELNNYISQYPQVSIFQSLKAKLYQLNSDPNYQTQLKKAAVFSPDRKKLYHFLIQPELTKKIEKVEQELEKAVEDTNSELSNKTLVEEITVAPIPTKAADLKKTALASSPLERYKVEKVKEIDPDAQARQQLEREILQHAVSSTIILDADQLTNETDEHEEAELVIEKAKTLKNEAEFNGLGVLDWLKSEEDTQEKPTPKKTSNDLISKFIKKEPQRIASAVEKKTFIEINRPKHEFFSPENMAKMSLMDNEDLVTETLAKIYAQQGNVSKASKAYDKLSLKFPEKSDYFARLKKELDNK